MTGYLTHLVERALGLIPILQPQPRSRFEQPPETSYEPSTGRWPEPSTGVWHEPGTEGSPDPGPGMPLGRDLSSGIGPHGVHHGRRPIPSPQPVAGPAGPRSGAVRARPTPGPEPTSPDLRDPNRAGVAQRLPIAEVDDPPVTGTAHHIYAPRESIPFRWPRADPPEAVPDAASVLEAMVEAASLAEALLSEHTGQPPHAAIRAADDPTGKAGPRGHEKDEPPPPRGPLITGMSAPSGAPAGTGSRHDADLDRRPEPMLPAPSADPLAGPPALPPADPLAARPATPLADPPAAPRTRGALTPRTPPSAADHASGPHPAVAPPAHHAAQFPGTTVRDALPSMSPLSMSPVSVRSVETPPRVVVNIGRVEVRTRQKTAPPEAPRSGQARQTPAERGAQPLSLGDYLASRAEKSP